MKTKTLHRYLEAREKIDASADTIISISSILSAFEDWPDDKVSLSPHALGHLHDMIKLHACQILEALDDFIHITDAENAVKKDEKDCAK